MYEYVYINKQEYECEYVCIYVYLILFVCIYILYRYSVWYIKCILHVCAYGVKTAPVVIAIFTFRTVALAHMVDAVRLEL